MMNRRSKRTQEEILYDILLTILNRSGRIKQTQLMTKANLSYKLMKNYLEDLVKKDYVDFIKKNDRKYLIITDKGRDFLDNLIKVKTFKETMGLD